MLGAYLQNKDIYAWIASFIYNVPYEECKEFRPDGTKNPQGKERRTSVKGIILGKYICPTIWRQIVAKFVNPITQGCAIRHRANDETLLLS